MSSPFFNPISLAPTIDSYVRIRRHMHKFPELGFEEFETSKIVANHLVSLGLKVETGIGQTGVVAVVEGRAGHSDRSVALRADMDALPIQEVNSFDHKSTVSGKMHGCGHDGHTTMLLAAARLLSENVASFSGRVILIFQPGEEGHAGARAMLRDDLLKRFPFQEIYGLHNWPGLEVNSVATNLGKMMAGIDRFNFKILGRGGHGGHQEQTNDPIMPMIQIVQSMQTIVSKNVCAQDEAVVSFNLVKSGGAGALSVVPHFAEIEGMAKWFDLEVGGLLQKRTLELVKGIGAAFNVDIEETYEQLYPPTVNHPEQAQRVVDSATKMLGQDRVILGVPPSMGSEDFSFFLQSNPGAFYRLGQGRPNAPLHSPNYDFNDDIISTGAALHAQIALDALQS